MLMTKARAAQQKHFMHAARDYHETKFDQTQAEVAQRRAEAQSELASRMSEAERNVKKALP